MKPVLFTEGALLVTVKALDDYRKKCLEEIEGSMAQTSQDYRAVWEEELDKVINIMMSLGGL